MKNRNIQPGADRIGAASAPAVNIMKNKGGQFL